MRANRQSDFISFPEFLHVRYTKTFFGEYFGDLDHNIHGKQKVFNFLQYCIPAVSVSVRLLLTLVFASNLVCRNLWLSFFLIGYSSFLCHG
jgi:hypothetical protein